MAALADVAAMSAVFAVAEAFERLFWPLAVSLPVAAIRYPLRHPAVRSVVVGSARPEAVRENLERARETVPEQVWASLRDEGLIP